MPFFSRPRPTEVPALSTPATVTEQHNGIWDARPGVVAWVEEGGRRVRIDLVHVDLASLPVRTVSRVHYRLRALASVSGVPLARVGSVWATWDGDQWRAGKATVDLGVARVAHFTPEHCGECRTRAILDSIFAA